jgi:hypothetical protein
MASAYAITPDQLAQARSYLAHAMTNLGHLADQILILEELARNPGESEHDKEATVSTVDDAVEAGDMLKQNIDAIVENLLTLEEAARK